MPLVRTADPTRTQGIGNGVPARSGPARPGGPDLCHTLGPWAAVARALRRTGVPRPGARRRLSARRTREGPRRLAAARRPGQGVPRLPERAVLPVLAVRPRLPGLPLGVAE